MTARTVYRFAAFELDPLALELRRAAGARIPAQEHPLRILLALLRRPGQVVSRGELAAALWPPGTYVDAEHGLNTAIQHLSIRGSDRGARRVGPIPGRLR